MKIRIQGNSIRLRLSQSEVKAFGETGRVEEKTTFPATPPSALMYVLEQGQVEQPTASFSNQLINITIPASLGMAWANSDQVGIEHETLFGNGQSLRILVEKDFKCLTERSGEDESDHFPNPNMKC
jgi:hypothetical protein